MGTVKKSTETSNVVLQEGAPSLRRRFAAPHHVFADAALADVDAEFEQLAVNAGRTPTGIVSAHLTNEFSGLAGNDGSSGLSVPNFPNPKQAKAFAMPGHDCFGFNEDQRRTPIAPKA